jgi:hypothetical protein
LQYVFVIDTNKKPCDPCHPKVARNLLRLGKAAVFKRYPFTIVLKEPFLGPTSEYRLKIDPGSKVTGIAIVSEYRKEVVFAANLKHRGSFIKDRLEQRRLVRRSRRKRQTRYRQPRFLNRAKPKGWLAPSLMSRVHNTETWVRRFIKFCPITQLSQELVRFDTQKMQNPEVSGVEYQQGELFGYEVREYLL